ncbi:hypothetical protein V2J09_005062 [Rumex salicifolius]
MATRVTLTRSVLNTIPTHTISTILLSSSTCHQIDKICRDFVWGSYDGGKRIHLVDWKTLCLPRNAWCLDIRPIRKANVALIGKLGWQLLTNSKALWSKVLTAKYKVGYGNIQETVRARKASSTGWKSILRGLKEVVLPGLKWNVFTGQNVRFWSDSWVLTTPLADHALQQIPNDAFNVKALSKNREFTTASAYGMLIKPNSLSSSQVKLYGSIWKLHIPEKIKIFLWLCAKHKQLTSQERCRRRMSDNPNCSLCNGASESLIHLLRYCRQIRQV